MAQKTTAKRRTSSSRVTTGGGGLKLNRQFNSPLAFLFILLVAVAGGIWVWKSFAATQSSYVYVHFGNRNGLESGVDAIDRFSVDTATRSTVVYSSQYNSSPIDRVKFGRSSLSPNKQKILVGIGSATDSYQGNELRS